MFWLRDLRWAFITFAELAFIVEVADAAAAKAVTPIRAHWAELLVSAVLDELTALVV